MSPRRRGLPHGWAIPTVITSALGLAALLGAYRHLTGLGTVTGGGRRVGMWIGLIVIAAAAAMVVIVMADRPAVTVIATLTFMPVAAVAGRQVDDALRDSLRRGREGSR